MLFDSKHGAMVDRPGIDPRLPPSPMPECFATIIARSCTRLPLLNKSGRAAKLERLIEAGAWNDAALALIELELPSWHLRRLVYEDGEWVCTLSRQPNMPEALDDTADGSHAQLPLAILSALLAAQRMIRVADGARPSAVPQIRLATDNAVCCDNFV
jgi:hypothetical protein